MGHARALLALPTVSEQLRLRDEILTHDWSVRTTEDSIRAKESLAEARGFYYVHRARPFYESLCSFMAQGPCLLMVLEGDNAIQRWRDLMGATDPAKAAAALSDRKSDTNLTLTAAIDAIANAWELDRVEFKPYPCAGALQATVRACVNLHNRYHFKPEDIVDVECRLRMGDSPVQQGRERVFSLQTPQGEYGAHFSTPYIAAVALLKGRLALADFDDDALKDPDVLKLSSKIRREDDPNSGRPKYASGHVFVKTNDGKVYEERQHTHPGHVENPVSAADVHEKYRYNAHRLVSPEKAETLLRQVISIEQLSNMRELTEQLRF